MPQRVAAPDRQSQRQERFEALSLPLSGTLYSTAFRLTGEPTRAEDLVQETYARAWQKFDDYAEGTNFKAWIFRILILLSKNERRKTRLMPKASEVANDAVAPTPSDEKPFKQPEAGWGEFYGDFVDDAFKRALDKLDDRGRSILMMISLGELSYKECAEVMEIPVGTVMSLLFRARQQLQADLLDYARERRIIPGPGGPS